MLFTCTYTGCPKNFPLLKNFRLSITIYIIEHVPDIKYVSLYITKKNFNKSSTHFFQDTILFLDLFVTHKRIVAIATIVTELPIVPFLTCFFFCEGKCRSKFPKFLGHPVCVFRGEEEDPRIGVTALDIPPS